MDTPGANPPVKQRILVVDDDADIAKCVRRILVRAGFEVEAAGGPREALDRLEAFAPHLVLSDYRMPGMDGAELLAEVERRLPLAMRVMLSGHADLDSVLASVSQGTVCCFIGKPWDDRELVSMLRAVLAGEQPLARATGALYAGKEAGAGE
ncbi:MAG TPA: response regulator [Kofleriaceae bacterium]|nr:response regulator [Kofleriaceae bacterium]